MSSGSEVELNSSGSAFFFDFDGTLARIVDDPLGARVEAGLVPILHDLNEKTNGALAVISGRSVEQLEALLDPLEIALSGVHGQQLRDIGGAIEDLPYDKTAHGKIVSDLNAFAEDKPGVIVESKPGSVALHYRMAPNYKQACDEIASRIQAGYPGVHLLHGKMVLEFKMGARTKGDAVRTFMRRATFQSRRPLFFGDDVTDEHAFHAVHEFGGLGFKIGNGDTAADYRFDDIGAFHDWITDLADAMCKGGTAPSMPRAIAMSRSDKEEESNEAL